MHARKLPASGGRRARLDKVEVLARGRRLLTTSQRGEHAIVRLRPGETMCVW